MLHSFWQDNLVSAPSSLFIRLDGKLGVDSDSQSWHLISAGGLKNCDFDYIYSVVGCQGVDVGASLIEVTPHLINVGPFGSELSIDLPGAISVEDVGLEVRAASTFMNYYIYLVDDDIQMH